jgi:hypothetical protein
VLSCAGAEWVKAAVVEVGGCVGNNEGKGKAIDGCHIRLCFEGLEHATERFTAEPISGKLNDYQLR